MRILLVDDDEKLATLLCEGLSAHGHACEAAFDGQAALERIRSGAAPELVLLDVTLPGRSGFELIGELKQELPGVPVLFLSGNRELPARVRGLKAGADDYITKPFELEELAARIEAVARRSRRRDVWLVADLRIDLDGAAAEREGRRIELSRREVDFLRALLHAEGRALSRVELLAKVWNVRFDPGTNVVDVLVARLRKKLDGRTGHVIRTEPGTGYSVHGRRGS